MKFEDKLKELQMYIGKEDAESRNMFNAILAEIQSMELTDDDRKELSFFIQEGISQVEASIDKIEQEIKIRDQIKDSLEILPLSYIAKNYFGKSASWLYQRINGNKVRGKVYTLNKDEIEIFNRALKEIGDRIGSLSINC
ncbi:DUF5053 domain-containing protein [uncultured Bacteroides sp.]|uniref:DUF5053 domain-containing protein n=1 Tax=uncultured Bacteroides sp. TaxID=162156 RepID=UPI00262C67DC|nr:DUF5053 domain-containing protein [uncultured Bacteroides sp.]